MEKYKGLIDATLTALAEAAKLTEQTWDDAAVAAARTVFDRLFGPVRVGGLTPTVGEAIAYADEAAMPPWALPLILEVVRIILNRWGK